MRRRDARRDVRGRRRADSADLSELVAQYAALAPQITAVNALATPHTATLALAAAAERIAALRATPGVSGALLFPLHGDVAALGEVLALLAA